MDPITMATAARLAGKELSSTGTLILTAAQWIYQKITDKSSKPLRDIKGKRHYQDKTQYDRLCNLRRELTTDGAIPEEWILKDDCPIFQSSFNENAKQLKAEVEKLRVGDYPQRIMVVGLVSNIEDLFDSLKNGTPFVEKTLHGWHAYRPDGYEAMFFSDLALWLSIVLSRYDVKKLQTAELLKKWINYCQKVQDVVLLYRADEASANSPKAKLGDIIEALVVLHTNICKANKASSFNDKIQTINTSILDMSKNVFDLFHLLLEGVKHREIQVHPFLRQAAKVGKYTPDPDIQKLLKTQMGQWIVETFNRAGITSNSFENFLPIDIETVTLHISNDFSKMKNLELTGLWDFARKNGKGEADREVAIGNLNQIIELHRLLLMLYYVRESVVLGALVSQGLGDAWVYGDDAGKKIIAVLLNVIDDASKKLGERIENFWEEFYGEYRANAGAKKDDLDPCFKFLGEANKAVDQIKGCHKSIQKTLAQIKQDAEDYKEDESPIRDKERALKQNLVKYGEVTKFNIGADFVIEPEANPSFIPRIVSVTQYMALDEEMALLSSTKESVIGCRKDSLPFYQKTEKLLGNIDAPVEDTSLIPLCNYKLLAPSGDCTEMQKHIYNDFLVANYRVITYPRALSFFQKISPFKMKKFFELYCRVNAAMHLLASVYKEGTPNRVEIKMIEMTINETIMEQATKYYTLGATWQESCFLINEKDGLLRITLNQEWSDFLKEALLQDISNPLIKRYNAKIKENKALAEQCNKLEVESVQKDIVIAGKDAAIAGKDAAILGGQAELAEQQAARAVMAAELTEQQAERAVMAADLARANEALKDMQRKIERIQKAQAGLGASDGLTMFSSRKDPAEQVPQGRQAAPK